MTAPRIRVTEDGPYEVTGGVPLVRCEIVANEDGESIGWEETAEIGAGDAYLLCRCGLSSDKPFCDFSHLAAEFDGTETASRNAFEDEAACIDGPGFRLKDARKLCAEARFCDRGGGLWNLVKRTDAPEVLAL
ncbi:MAG TPA: CDGSH iron-sulfur domain-containing protein, partial [Coriobacteriia bacterium]|nr:CDGSH iron-sulfur domain-containing protein [Coriobacteriia bacterium]